MRDIDNYVVCSFNEYWKEDWEYLSFDQMYITSDPVKIYKAPSWWRDGTLKDNDFYGYIYHTFSLSVSGMEKYIFSARSEHTLQDCVFTVTEEWVAKDFEGNILYGPDTEYTTVSYATLLTQFPFIDRSLSVNSTYDYGWFNFNCGAAGTHYCSPITWFDEELPWPAVSFNESFSFTITDAPGAASFYNGQDVYISVNLSSSGAILCGCSGLYERTGNLRLSSYNVNVHIYGEGPLSTRIKLDPVDMMGNSISEGKKAHVLFGPLYTVAGTGLVPVGTVNNATFTGDTSRYCFEEDLPLDKTYTFPVRTARYSGGVVITSAPVYWDEGWGGGLPSDPNRYIFDQGDQLRSQLWEVQVKLDKHTFLGLPAASGFVNNFDDSHPGLYCLHRFHPEANATCRNVATVKQDKQKVLAGQPFTFNVNPFDGSYSTSGTDQIFNITASVANFDSTLGFATFKPYRYLVFDYDVASAGSASLTVTLNDTNKQKVYEASLNNSGTCRIDLCYPTNIISNVAGEASGLMASRMTTENQGDGLVLKERFSGFRTVTTARFRLSGPNTVTIRNIRKEADTAQIMFNGWYQSKEDTTGFGAWGQIDFKDAYRIRTESLSASGSLVKIVTQQSLTATYGDWSLPSTWKSPTTLSGLTGSARGSATSTLYDYYSAFDADMNYIGLRDVTQTIPVYITAGADKLRIYHGIKQDVMLGGSQTFILQCESVFGTLFEATAFKRVKDAALTVTGASLLSDPFTYNYTTNASGLGIQPIPFYRPKDIVSDPAVGQNVQHYVPSHPIPQTKQLVYMNANRNVYWVGISFFKSGNKVSYDVSDSQRHYRAFIVDNSIYFGYSDNSLTWSDSDTGLTGESVAMRIDRRDKEVTIYLLIEQDGSIVQYQSINEGDSFTDMTTIADGRLPAILVSVDKKKYVYWIDDGNVKGKIFDSAGNTLKDTFTAVSGVDEDGLAVDESFEVEGSHRIVLMVKVSGTITQYVGNGITFS